MAAPGSRPFEPAGERAGSTGGTGRGYNARREHSTRWRALALILAAACAVVYGLADFCGGKSTRHAGTWTVTAGSQMVGLVTILLALPFLTDHGPVGRDLVLGGIGGLAGGTGVMLLYHALAHGTMSIVSPVTAVCAAVVPVVCSLALFGQRPGALALVGIAVAIVAIALVSLQHTDRSDAHVMRTIGWSLAAGLGFGVFFVFLDRTSDDAGLWPLVAARPMSIALAATVALSRRQPVVPTDRKAWPMVAAAGAGDMGANILFLLASTHGDLAITAAVSSLYPVSTVALARVVDHERLRPTQVVGLLAALVALVLIAL